MTLILKIVVFLAGFYLSIRLIAALYGILDLWYTIRTAYPRVIRGILGWSAPVIAIVLLAPSSRGALLWGMVAFAAYYLFSFALLRLLLGGPWRTTETELGYPGRPTDARGIG